MCPQSEAVLDVIPLARITHFAYKLVNDYVSEQQKLIYLHVSADNLDSGYNGGQGNNGGWRKQTA